MSKYFVLGQDGIGPGGQIYFRKSHPKYNWYHVFLDKQKIGQVMQDTQGHWSGLSFAEHSKWFNIRSMDGFATRFNAAEFVIKHNGYWMRREEEQEERNIDANKFLFRLKMKRAYEIMKGAESI